MAFDSVNSRAKYDYYYGLNTYLFNPNMTYMVIPRVDEKVCFANAQTQPAQPLQSLLPNVSTWTYVGQQTIGSVSCNNFQQVSIYFGTPSLIIVSSHFLRT